MFFFLITVQEGLKQTYADLVGSRGLSHTEHTTLCASECKMKVNVHHVHWTIGVPVWGLNSVER